MSCIKNILGECKVGAHVLTMCIGMLDCRSLMVAHQQSWAYVYEILAMNHLGQACGWEKCNNTTCQDSRSSIDNGNCCLRHQKVVKLASCSIFIPCRTMYLSSFVFIQASNIWTSCALDTWPDRYRKLCQDQSWGSSPYLSDNINRVSTRCYISRIPRHCIAINSTPPLRWITRFNIQWPSRQRLWNVGGGFLPHPKDVIHSFRWINNNNNNKNQHEDDSEPSVGQSVTVEIEQTQVGRIEWEASHNLILLQKYWLCLLVGKLGSSLQQSTYYVCLTTQYK